MMPHKDSQIGVCCMAWEKAVRQGQTLNTGDKPVDELALTLKKLALIYQDRYDRKPLLAEILYALEVVLLADPNLYIADSDNVVKQEIFVTVI
jgi:hypothetical protein